MAWTNIILPFPVYQQSEEEECEQFWKRIEGTISVNSMVKEETAFWFLLGIREEFVRRIQFDPEKSLWLHPASLYENAQLIDEKVYLEGPFRKHRFQHCSNFSLCTMCGKWGHKDKQCINGVLSSMQQSQLLRKLGGLYYRAGADEPTDYDEWEDPTPKIKLNGSNKPVESSVPASETFYDDVHLEDTKFTVSTEPSTTETVSVKPKPDLRQDVTDPTAQAQLSNAQGNPSSTEKDLVKKDSAESVTAKPEGVSSENTTGTPSSNDSAQPPLPKAVTKGLESSPAKMENIPKTVSSPKLTEEPTNTSRLNSPASSNARASTPSTFKISSPQQSSPRSPYSRPAGPRPDKPAGGHSGPQNRPAAPGSYSGPQTRPSAPGGYSGPQNRPAAPGSYSGPQNRSTAPGGHPGSQSRPAAPGGYSGPQNRPAAPGRFSGPQNRPAASGGYSGPQNRPMAPGGHQSRQNRPVAPGGRTNSPRGPFRAQAPVPKQENIVWETPNRGDGNNPNQNVWEDHNNANQNNTWELPERGRKHLQNLQRFSKPY